MKYVNHIIGGGNVTLIFENHHPINILDDNPQYHAIVAALRQQKFDIATSLSDKATALNDTAKGKFFLKNGRV